MVTFEVLAARQQETGEDIQRIISNFRKDPASRKIKPYHEERLSRLEEASKEFRSTHQQILNLSDVPRQHEYFTKDFFIEIESLVTHYRKIFKEAIEADTPETSNREPEQILHEAAKPDAVPTGIIRKQQVQMESMARLLSSTIEENKPKQYYRFKFNTIEQLWKQIEASNLLIWETTEDPETKGYNTQEYIGLEGRVQEALMTLSLKLVDQVPETIEEKGHLEVQLPKITIPKFDGSYLKWPQFFDLFTEMIHKKSIDNIQKMWFLKTNLTGEAERLIRHLALTRENYTTAWETLKNRYHNKRILTSTIIQRLVDQSTSTADSTSMKNVKLLHDTTRECLLALQALEIPTGNWDPLLLHLLIKKLDSPTRILYEQSVSNPREIQTIENFLNFLESRFYSLEAVSPKSKPTNSKTCSTLTSTPTTEKKTAKNSTRCQLCHQEAHPLYACRTYLQQTTANRYLHLKQNKLCFNCLKSGHRAESCASRSCKKCSKKHHSTLHIEAPVNKVEPGSTITTAATEVLGSIISQPITLTTSRQNRCKGFVVLSTVRINARSSNGDTIECRAVLDSGSQINIVTERFVRLLGLSPRPAALTIEGIGKGTKKSNNRVVIDIESRTGNFTSSMEAFILPQIISQQPSHELDISNWELPANICLADPEFYKPDKIDLLLGAEYYPLVLSTGQIKQSENLPVLQNTQFGWIVAGKINQDVSDQPFCGLFEEDTIDNLLSRFWTLDETGDEETVLSESEKQCETHFAHNTQRTPEGRFIVKMPFINEPTVLGQSLLRVCCTGESACATNLIIINYVIGQSLPTTIRRFFSLEKRLSGNPEVQKQYVDFMEEYEKLGHMQEISFEEIVSPHYFIPHHCVLRPDSSTTKLRVVFDASCKTSSNISLNDILHKGPTVQSELFSILLRFRIPRFVVKTDIEKMYRQIVTDPKDRMMQLIVWRKNPADELKYYQLKTITYGTRSAPFLATRCLQQVAKEAKARYPLGAAALENDFYVDDGITGSDSLTEALEIQRQLTLILREAGFKLRKWSANHQQLLQGIPNGDQEVNLELSTDDNKAVKTLGLTWIPKTDNFSIKTNVAPVQRISKRAVVSDIARIYDPLGILAPIVVTAKIFIQKLWESKLDWDDVLPEDHQAEWRKFRNELNKLNNTTIPRHMFNGKNPTSIQLHCFTDASTKAYGAAVYIRAVLPGGTIIVRLLCAKSRVAPLKVQTIPRLELCAAVIGAQLMTRIKKDLKFEYQKTYFWTDSMVVLAWINSSPSSFQTFVAHRITRIQELTKKDNWRHVDTNNNPADILSRGLPPGALQSSSMWFYGPLFLHGRESCWSAPIDEKVKMITENTERKRTKPRKSSDVVSGTTVVSEELMYKINSHESFTSLKRIIAYVLRFVARAKGIKDSSEGKSSVLSQTELNNSLKHIVRTIQRSNFKDELLQIQHHGKVSKKSPLSSLDPFLDDDGILRVGGRLENALLPYDSKHPMLLPYNDNIAKIIMLEIHRTYMHSGPQALLAQVRRTFWPIKGKIMARSIVEHCLRCRRAKPSLYTQLMGNLPPTRVQPARPFLNTGVDFCGPLWIHFKIRGKRPQKAYIAVYCCFATKAVHLEVVSDLTTEGFLGSLKRFIARRGYCKNIYCDNATNFVGARNQLAEVTKTIHDHSKQEKIIRACSDKGITFNFIPPRAPHFGGLWEAAVKSAKHLLIRSASTASLTYEELETVIVEIEAVLNSRPITPMSNDPNDLSALTPGHFLIGEALTAPIDGIASEPRLSLHARWKQVSSLKQIFWKQWSTEYLNELQNRYKWKDRSPNVETGTMVIVKEDNAAPLQWPLGRITKVYKGEDGAVRVADVKMANGTFKRPIHRLAPLFPSNNEESHTPQVGDQKSLLVVQNRPQAEETTQPTRKRPRLSLGATILNVLCVCLLVLPTGTESLKVEPFKNNPGLYFEKLGTAGLITTEWDLVTFFNLEPYWRQFEMIKHYPNIIKRICHGSSSTKLCTGISSQLNRTISDLAFNNKLLMPSGNQRSKRGFFNIVGNVANTLFGVMDSQDANKLEETIVNLRQNSDQLEQQIRNQTSFIDSTLTIMKKTQDDIDDEFQHIEFALNKTTSSINAIKRSEEMTQELTEAAFYASTLLRNYERVQDSLIDIVMDSHHGKINPELLPPEQLQFELLKVEAKLPKSVTLPAPPANLLGYYNLMKIQGRVTRKFVIFTIKIPLLSAEQFELLNIIPVPWMVDQNFITIKPSSPYLIVDLYREQYPLSAEELRQCQSIRENQFFCHQHHPLFRRGSAKAACDINLLSQFSIPSSCPTRTTSPAPHWIQLHNSNSWIYVLEKNTLLNTVCGTNLSQTLIHGAGVLSLEGDCVIKQPLVTIQGHTILGTNRTISYTPAVNISDMILEAPLESTYKKEFHVHRTELTSLKQQLSTFRDNVPLNSYYHNIHHYALGYSVIGLIVIGTAIFTLRTRCRGQQERTCNLATSPQQTMTPFSINID